MTRRLTTYGLSSPDADITATDVTLGPMSAAAIVHRRGRRVHDSMSRPAPLGPLTLNVPGRHNLQNALATVAVGLELGLSFDVIANGLREFRGAERRFEVRGEPNGILIVDDYGHHPTEIAAVLDAARGLGRPTIVAFQPHRFTRTAALMDAFGPALSGAAHIILTEIYAAGEDPIPGITAEALAASIRRSTAAPVDVVGSVDDVAAAVARIARPGHLVITLGAGSIGTVADRLVELLAPGGVRQ